MQVSKAGNLGTQPDLGMRRAGCAWGDATAFKAFDKRIAIALPWRISYLYDRARARAFVSGCRCLWHRRGRSKIDGFTDPMRRVVFSKTYSLGFDDTAVCRLVHPTFFSPVGFQLEEVIENVEIRPYFEMPLHADHVTNTRRDRAKSADRDRAVLIRRDGLRNQYARVEDYSRKGRDAFWQWRSFGRARLCELIDYRSSHHQTARRLAKHLGRISHDPVVWTRLDDRGGSARWFNGYYRGSTSCFQGPKRFGCLNRSRRRTN